MGAIDELELVRAVMRGGDGARDREAELCARLLPRVRLFLGRRLADIYAVDDVTQDALVTVVLSLRRGSVRDVESFHSFVLGVARNKLREHVRRHRPFSAPAAAAVSDAQPEPAFAMPRPLLGRLEECLGKLRERERTLLRFTFCDCSTAADIGAQLGLSEENVRVIRHRALSQLRDCAMIERYEVER